MKLYISALAIALVLGSCQKEKPQVVVTEEDTVESNAPVAERATGKECYLKVIGRDSIMLQMQRNGDSVTGNFYWKPAEKDSKRNTFKGVLKGTTATTIAEVTGEGMTSREDFNFTVQNSTVAVTFAEMEEGTDGVWHYKTGTPSSKEVLNLVDCK